MVTREEFEAEVLGSVAEFWSICRFCGECCKKLAIPLHALELPSIARAFKSNDELRRYILRNPYPLNIQSEFYLKIDSMCPFLVSARCTTYQNRPLVCRLFPIQVIAFRDNPSSRFRDPLFWIVSGEARLPCMTDNILLEERMRMRMESWGRQGEKVVDYMVAAIVDDVSFGYLFGQEPELGPGSFSPSLDELEPKSQIDREFCDALYERYRDSRLYSIEAWERLAPLSDDETERITSGKQALRATRESRRLLKRMEKHEHPYWRWKEYILDQDSRAGLQKDKD